MRETLTAFNGGETSPVLYGRTDLPGTRRSARIMRNFLAGVTGGAFRRPPSLHCGMAQDADSALIAFSAGEGDGYFLEIGNLTLRVWDLTGAIVATLAAPWTAAQAAQVRATQSNDYMWLVHPSVEPQELQRTVSGWALTALPWLWPPLRDVNTSAVTVASAEVSTGVVDLTASAALFDARHVGAFWQLSHFREEASADLTVAVSVEATNYLNFSAVPTAGDQFAIGSVAYRWAASPASPYEVEIGAAAEACRDNALAAVNGTGGGIGTAPHLLVTAEAGGSITAGGVKATATLAIANMPGAATTVTIGSTVYTAKDTPSAAYEFKRGANKEEYLDNLQKAVTATGVAGTDYGVGTLVHPSVTAAVRVGASVKFTATTAGSAGNSIALAEDSVHLTWSSATLSGGEDGSIEKLKIKSRSLGSAGNGIACSVTGTAATWAAAATAGASETSAESSSVKIKGQWQFTTYGRWQGTVYIEQQDAAGAWNVVRQFTGRLDRNITAEGIADAATWFRVRVANLAGAEASDVPQPRFVLEATETVVHGLVRITSVTDSTHARASVVSELHSNSATSLWREGAFSDYRGYPHAIALHEERLLFAGNASEPQKVWGSAAGDFRNFENTGLSDGSWQYQFTSREANQIRWMLSGRGLVVGASGAERTWESGDNGITPIHPPLQRQITFNGAAAVAPVSSGGLALFVQRGGLALLEYGYEAASESYIAPDLTQLCDHLTQSGIAGLAMARSPWPIVWAWTHDGQLLACTYARREEVVAWTPQDLGGTVSSVAVVAGATGQADEVWLVVTRDGTTRIERLDAGHWQRLRKKEVLWHADGAVVATATAGVASGFAHLNGRTVHVLADGVEIEPRLVEGGVVRVPATVSSLIAGVCHDAVLQPALFDFVTQSGSSVGKRFNVKQVHARFYRTRGCQVAAYEGAESNPVPFRDTRDPVESAPPLFDGMRTIQVNGAYLDGISTVFTATGIQPLNILSMNPEFELHG